MPYVMAALYVFAGVMHFLHPRFYLQIMPPALPAHAELVALSGVAEILLGVGLVVPGTRRLAAWGVIALLIAVYPANIYQALHNPPLDYRPAFMDQPSHAALWMRLPLQFVLMYWAWRYTR